MTRIINTTDGAILVIADEDDDICEMCGKLEECRPYGPGGQNVCFDCAMKDEKEASRQFNKQFGISEH